MSNEWNATNPKIWETPPLPAYQAPPPESSVPSNFYAGAPSTSYYNTPPPQPQYPGPGYQHPSQMVTGYSFNPSAHSSSNVLQSDTSMVLQAVNTLNHSLGGLDIDPELINALNRHIQNEKLSNEKLKKPEIYSPTFNSPSPSPERDPSKESMIEVDGKKLSSSRPFYEQFNHYEDETENDRTSIMDHSSRRRRSRSLEKRSWVPRERTWAGSTSPPSPHRQDTRGHSPQYGAISHRSRSPLTLHSRYEERGGRSRSPLKGGRGRSPLRGRRSRSPMRGGRSRSPLRVGRSRSPLRRTRSKSRESNRVNKELKEKVVNLLGMSKSENRKFTSAQKTSNVLLVMNLDSWITDKVLWGAIHKYARDFGTKPPFYIERASFHLSKELNETFLALIAFLTVDAAEMCMMHTKCELEVTGRQKKSFKMMYYTENTIMFDALGYKFMGLWRAVLKKRAEQREDRDNSPSDHEERERSRGHKSRDRSPLYHKDESRPDKKLEERKSHSLPQEIENKELVTESRQSSLPKPTEVSSPEIESPLKNTASTPTSTVIEESKTTVSTVSKSQANIIKTNVLIGKMKSYLLKQNKPKTDKDEDINQMKSGQNSFDKLDKDDNPNEKGGRQDNKNKGDTNKSESKSQQSGINIEKMNKNDNKVSKMIPNVEKSSKCESSLKKTSKTPIKQESADSKETESLVNKKDTSKMLLKTEGDKPPGTKNGSKTVNIKTEPNQIEEKSGDRNKTLSEKTRIPEKKSNIPNQTNNSQKASIDLSNVAKQKNEKGSLSKKYVEQDEGELFPVKEKCNVTENEKNTIKKEIELSQKKAAGQDTSKKAESEKNANKKEPHIKISEDKKKSEDTESTKITNTKEIERNQNKMSEDKKKSSIDIKQPQNQISENKETSSAEIKQPLKKISEDKEKSSTEIKQPEKKISEDKEKPSTDTKQPQKKISEGKEKPSTDTKQPEKKISEDKEKPSTDTKQPQKKISEDKEKPSTDTKQPQKKISEDKEKPSTDTKQPQKKISEDKEKPSTDTKQPQKKISEGKEKPSTDTKQPLKKISEDKEKPSTDTKQPLKKISEDKEKPSTDTKQPQKKISEDKEKSSTETKQPQKKISEDKEKSSTELQPQKKDDKKKSSETESEKTNKKEVKKSENTMPEEKGVSKDKQSSSAQKERNREPQIKETREQDVKSKDKEMFSKIIMKEETKQPNKSVDKRLEKDKESDSKSSKKRKLSPERESSRNVKQGKRLDKEVEDPVSAREREEEEAELFGKGLKKFTSNKNRSQSNELGDKGYKGRHFDRREDSPYRRDRDRGMSREDRFGNDDRRRGGYRRQNWEHQDKRRRGDLESFDDIDGNEESYWNKKKESPKQPETSNPWIKKETSTDKVGLSLKELKDPEFLLRVLLQTSIMIQNNQLTMANPLDSLTPIDKDLIIQTLNEIEATNQDVIYDTLNDRNKFNAAENRVLVEALSNVHMFKAALLPPGSLNVSEDSKDVSKGKSFNFESPSEGKTETEVYVQMTGIKSWVTKDHIIRHLRRFTLQFDHVKISPCLRNETFTEGFIKFKDIESASELLKRTNRVLYIGKDTQGIQLSISDVTKKIEKWTCNSCSMRNSCDTLICQKCQKLKEKLRDVIVSTEVTNRLALINFKKATSVDDINQILKRVAPFLSYNVSAHIDSTSDQVVHFIIELPNPQACSMLKKCIRDNMGEFSSFQAGPRVAISFIQPAASSTPQQKVYTFADVPRLAQYSASLYATNEEERMKYFNHYTTLYTQELIQGKPINVVLPEDNIVTPQVTGPPTGTDDRQWPPPNVAAFTYDQNSGYYYDHSTGLYYEASSQYFYNMTTGKFLLYDSTRCTYVLVQSSEISSAPVKSASAVTNVPTKPQVPEESTDDQTASKISTVPKESKIHAKKVMKDLVKWSKSVNKQDKKKAIPNPLNPDLDVAEKASPADVGFDILRKTESSKSTVTSVQSISSLIMDNHTVCEDEEEEYAHIDWKNFTCNLCHRVFNNADILNKHSKLSELHRNNLKQWYISKNLDPDNEDNRKQEYRNRAAERRNKTGGKSESRSQARSSSPGETWLCSIPGCMAYKRSGYDTCYSCDKQMAWGGSTAQATPATPDMSVGSQLLKKMGWESGTGLGKAGQGTRNPINVEKQSGYLGLGAQKPELRDDSESYGSYIKRSTQKRFQQLSRN